MRKDLDALLDRLAARLGSASPDAEIPALEPLSPAEAFRQKLVAAGAPPRHQGVPHDLVLPGKAAAWDGSTPWAVTFLGTPGTGKTWAATALFGRLRVADRNPRHGGLWITAPKLLEEVVAGFGSSDDGRMMERAKTVHLMLLDDFLSERDTDFAAERIAQVLSHRYDEFLPTIVTSNAPDLRTIAAKEPRLASRLGEGIVIRMAGEDKRLRRERDLREATG